jgi:non-ribosomal peptide synthetase component F
VCAAPGGELVLASKEAASDPAALMALVASSRAAAMQATPASWRMLLRAGWRGAPGLTALCGGEALPPDLAAELVPRVGAVQSLGLTW